VELAEHKQTGRFERAPRDREWRLLKLGLVERERRNRQLELRATRLRQP
jgi:hypothetical protein